MHLIEVDNFTSVRQAVEYFASLGHRKIGFVGGDMDVANIRDRYSAYLQTMKTLELEIDRDWIIDDLSENTVAGATEGAFRLLGRKNLPTAVIACNDPVSIALYQVAHERGLRIPEDLSIISFDNDPETQFLTPPLTTFKQPFAEIGRASIDLLMRLIDRPPVSGDWQKVDVGMSLVIRESVLDMVKTTLP